MSLEQSMIRKIKAIHPTLTFKIDDDGFVFVYGEEDIDMFMKECKELINRHLYEEIERLDFVAYLDVLGFYVVPRKQPIMRVEY